MAAELGRVTAAVTAAVMGVETAAVTAGAVETVAVAPGPVMVMVMVMATGMANAKTRTAVRDLGRVRERARAVTEGRRDLRQGASTKSPARLFRRC